MKPLRIETLAAHSGASDAFEGVREAVAIYGAGTTEPIAAEATRLVAWRGDSPLARVSLETAPDLHDAPGLTGMVGGYEALEPAAGVALLVAACRALAAQGVARVLGPMNGSTWSRYRLALRPAAPTQDDDPPPFLAEPWNPARYPEDFDAAGFAVAAQYESRVDDSLGTEADDAESLAGRVRAAGLVVRALDPTRFEEELESLFALSLAAFAGNLYYTPIDANLFRDQYRKIRPLIDPELVLVAEDSAGRPVGFQFAFRDPLTPAGAAPRAIVKTVATAPATRGMGLGGHMLDLIRRRAHASGCRSVIHALMHVKNFSMRMSARHRTRVFRRYALYQWTP